MNAQNISECLVVGAGISGLAAAGALLEAGITPLVVDKGRGLGGRLATRRLREVRLDHGAQFFKVAHPRFRQLVEQWSGAGVVSSWGEKFPLQSGYYPEAQGIHYCGREGMTAIAKHMGEGLLIRKACRVVSIAWQEGLWEAATDAGAVIKACSVILTAPVPQTLELLKAGRVELPEAVCRWLAGVRYAPCMAAMVLLDGSSRIPRPGGVWLKDPMSWIADNTLKGIQSEDVKGGGLVGVTIHSGAAFAEKHWDDDPAEVADLMGGLAQAWLGSPIVERQLHRWRYAQVLEGVSSPCLALEKPGPLVLAGDAFGSGGVEGAVLSGWAAAETIQRTGNDGGLRMNP